MTTDKDLELIIEEKKFLKVYVVEHDTTVIAVIADRVEKLWREEKR